MKPPIADRIRTPTLIPSIVVSVIVVGGTFALGPLMKVTRPDDWCAVFVYWCFGTTAAGGGVVAVWSSLGLGPFIIREAVGLGLALLLAISGVMGALLAGERFDNDFIGPLLSVPARARKAANQGEASAQNLLGVIYYNGNGVRRNRRQAIQFFQMAARQGNEDASQNLRDIEESIAMDLIGGLLSGFGGQPSTLNKADADDRFLEVQRQRESYRRANARERADYVP